MATSVNAVKSLLSCGFTLATAERPKRLIMSIGGLRGRGKTHLALGAPAPIAYFDLDFGADGVLSKIADKKTIMRIPLAVPENEALAVAEWEKFVKAWRACLKSSEIRSIVVDTETELWELFRMSKFGKLSQVPPYLYGPVNAAYGQLFKEAMGTGSDKNLIFCRHLKPVYINDKKTANYEAAGFGGIEKIVDVDVIVDKVDGEMSWELEVNKSRFDPALISQTIGGEMATFAWLAAMAVPGTGPDDWS